MKITREELQAIENHMSNIPAVAGMYTPVLIAWCHALLNDNDNAYQRGAEATTYTIGETEWAQRIAVAEQRFVDEYDARKAAERERDELLRVNKGAARHGIITEHVRELTELLGIQRQNPTANETVDAAATEIETLRTTVEELKARITTLEAMKP